MLDIQVVAMATNVTWSPTTPEEMECYHGDEGEGRTLENHLWIYTAPIILVFSICGNVMTIIIMTQKCMRGTSTCVYLTLMAAADLTVVVVGIIPEWLEQMNFVSVWELHPWVCRVELYLYYTSIDFAIWILVAFTIDRVIAVCFPFHKKRYCTTTRAFVACFIIFLISNLNLHVFWTRGKSQCSNCRDLDPYETFEHTIRPWVVLVFASILPFVIILACNIVIVCEIMRSRGVRETKGFKQTTIMCLSISFAFLILVTPNIVLLVGKKYWQTPENISYQVARAVASQFVYINHSINFLLYALTGSRFREEVVAKCSFRKKSSASEPLSSRMMSLTPSDPRASYPSTPVVMTLSPRFTTQKSVAFQNGKRGGDIRF